MSSKMLNPWKFTRDNYSIVWQSPDTTTRYIPTDDEPDNEEFNFSGTCVTKHYVCACWDNEDTRNMAMVPCMITVHVTMCRQDHPYSLSRNLLMNQTFQIPIDNILRNQLVIFSDEVTSPRYISAIRIKIAIPNNSLPTIEAIYCDPDGDVHDVEETGFGEIAKDEDARIWKELKELASDIDAIRKVRTIIPRMDSYWKDYVEYMYPELYDSFEKELLKSMAIIKNSAMSAADAATMATKAMSSRDRIQPQCNPEILDMVAQGMCIYKKEIDKFDDSQCEAIAESLNIADHVDTILTMNSSDEE